MIVLGLETSCDDTAAGIVDDNRRMLANIVADQTARHRPYGGVVPEIAARAHLDLIGDMVAEALKQAGLNFADLSGIAATCGPGLIGGVMVGAMTGKAIAAVRGLPFIGVNHLEAHALTPRLDADIAFPYLLLLLSGGHSQALLVKGVGSYVRLGGTIDDAVGECFDKAAKLLGLGYPGGPLIEQAAKTGNAKAFDLPRPMLGREGCDFSFSGLKTAVRALVDAHPIRGDTFVADAAAALQAAIADILADRAEHAIAITVAERPTALVVAGGVAANGAIREKLQQTAAKAGLPFAAPPLRLCTDNGAMVAWAGLERLRLGFVDGLDIAARPRWPLDSLAETAGKR